MSILKILKQKENIINNLNEKQRFIKDKMKAARIREIAVEELIKPFDMRSKFFEELISVSVLHENSLKVRIEDDNIYIILNSDIKPIGVVSVVRDQAQVYLEFFVDGKKVDALKIFLSSIGENNLKVDVDPGVQPYEPKEVRWLIRDFIYSFGKIEE